MQHLSACHSAVCSPLINFITKMTMFYFPSSHDKSREPSTTSLSCLSHGCHIERGKGARRWQNKLCAKNTRNVGCLSQLNIIIFLMMKKGLFLYCRVLSLWGLPSVPPGALSSLVGRRVEERKFVLCRFELLCSPLWDKVGLSSFLWKQSYRDEDYCGISESDHVCVCVHRWPMRGDTPPLLPPSPSTSVSQNMTFCSFFV